MRSATPSSDPEHQRPALDIHVLHRPNTSLIFRLFFPEPDLVAEERRSVDDLRVELQELKRKRKEVWEKYEDAEVSVRAAQKEYKRAVAEAVFPDYILTEGETGFRKFVAKSRSALETYVNNLESRLISYSRRQLNSILRAAGLERSEI